MRSFEEVVDNKQHRETEILPIYKNSCQLTWIEVKLTLALLQGAIIGLIEQSLKNKQIMEILAFTISMWPTLKMWDAMKSNQRWQTRRHLLKVIFKQSF